jgi:hypothetical protein
MRVNVNLSDSQLKRLDALAGPRGRSGFIRAAVDMAIDREERRRLLQSAFGSISDTGHDWDEDPAAWVRQQRFEDPNRVG